MTPLLLRLLDPATRAEIFEPAYHEALAAHIESNRDRSPLLRRVHGLAFHVRAPFLVLECFRLQLLRSGRPRKQRMYIMPMLREARVALRGLRRRPAFTVVVIITLALGVGANTAIFSVVNAVLLRSLPYENADRLVVLWGDNTMVSSDRDPHAVDTFLDYRTGLDGSATVAAVSPQWNITLHGDGEPEVVPGYFASAEFLPMLGVRPIRGRLFGAADDRPEASPTVVIGYGLWQRRFGGADVVGREVRTSGGPATIIGVLPASFRWRDDAEMWAPLAHNPFWTTGGRRVRLLEIVAQREAHSTLAQLRAEAMALSENLAAQYPDQLTGITARVVPLLDDVVGDVRPVLGALLATAALVLLIACANIANLLLVRGDARRREVAVRAALGASRGQIAGQLLTESTLLSLAGGVAGFALAYAAVPVLLSFLPADVPRQAEIAVDGTALLFSLAITALTGLLFGLVPFFESVRTQPGASLKATERATGGMRTHTRSSLVVAEVALALVVSISATLLVRSFVALNDVDPGFDSENVVSMDLSALPADAADRVTLMQRVYARFGELPSVLAAGDVSRVPLSTTSGNITSSLQLERQPLPPSEQPSIDFRIASAGYFPAMRIPLLDGRPFQPGDADPDADPVVLVNSVTAQRFFENEDPLGERIQLGGGTTWFTIVGVIGAVHHTGLADEQRPEVYASSLQRPPSNLRLLVRTSGDPLEHVASLRAAIRETAPDLVISNVTTMEQIRYTSLATPRFHTLLFSLFALLALVLATVGTYGVMAYMVAQRRREIGLRMSLGARPRDVARLVVGHGFRLVLFGLTAGVAGAFALTGALRGLLFRVSPADPATFLGTALLLLATVLAACWITARRAAAVDPVRALREE